MGISSGALNLTTIPFSQERQQGGPLPTPAITKAVLHKMTQLTQRLPTPHPIPVLTCTSLLHLTSNRAPF